VRDAERDLPQDDTPVEITPLPAADKRSEEQNIPTRRTGENNAQVGKANRTGARRFILGALTVCLAIALILVTVVLPRIQTQKPIAHPSFPATSPTLNTSATPINTPTDYRVSTTIVDGVVYAGAANGGVYALRTSDGRLIWHHKIDPGADTAPLVSDGIVYISANISDVGPGILYALRARDGVELWHYTSSVSLSAPLLENGIVYVTSYDDISHNGGLFALRASDGAQLWHKIARGLSVNTPFVDNQAIYVSAFADNGSSFVYALRASDGTQLWLKTATTFVSMSLVANGIAYLQSEQELSALSASNGQLLWSVPIVENSSLPPQVINGVIYITTTQISLEGTGTPTSQGSILPQVGTIGKLLQSFIPRASAKQTLLLKQGISSVYAVRISDGAVLWHYSLSKENGNNWANWLSIEDGTVYVGSNVDQDKSYIYALRSDNGSLLWRQAMHKGMSVNASVASAIIYNASFISDGSTNAGSGAVYALQRSDGSQLWYHSMYWVVYDPPVLVGSTIFVSTASGDVYAFQASNGSQLWHFHTDVQ
jgi:outer membrane protein assembly factor BamB